MQVFYKYKNIYVDVKQGTKVNEVFKDEIAKSDIEIVACKFNNELQPLNYEINQDGEIEFINIGTKDGMRIYRRGLLYIVTKAIQELYPESLFTVHHRLHHALLCEIENMEITGEVIDIINKRVQEIIEQDLPIIKTSMTKEEAKSFYEREKTLKGILQLEVECKEDVTLYYCEDYYNYFYGIMPISTGAMKHYDIMEYDKRLLIRFPSSKTPTTMNEYSESKKLLESLDEYEDVHQVLEVDTLYKLNKIIKEGKIREYIMLDEALHEKKIANIADDIAKRQGVKVILIAGPSSSGKTTFAKRLEIQLRLNGLKPLTMSVDNYFVERHENPIDENGEYDFEAIEAVDTNLLNGDLVKLLNGEEIQAPTFNFSMGSKEYKGNIMKLEEDQVLIMEGIHCLNDQLTYLIPKEQKYKVYISSLTVLNMDYYNRIPTTDNRLLRRIVRDKQFRDYEAIHTLERWPSVNKGEAKNIFPYQEEADMMFNSSLIYEMCVLKNYAMPLLMEIDRSSPEFPEAQRLCTMLKYFEPIPHEYVPDHSLLKEFTGGSIFEH